MTTSSNALAFTPLSSTLANTFFANKLGFETDCSDVYADIKAGNNNYLLLDVRSHDAFNKSHAVTAINIPANTINQETFNQYDKKLFS